MVSPIRRQNQQQHSPSHTNNGISPTALFAGDESKTAKGFRQGGSAGKLKPLFSFVAGACCVGVLWFSQQQNCLMDWNYNNQNNQVIGSNKKNGNSAVESSATEEAEKRQTAAPINKDDTNNDSDWKWYDGDLNKYYNDLEKDHKRNPNNINDYAVHRWMGPKRSTEIHYQLIHDSIYRHAVVTSSNSQQEPWHVLDAGCGLGSALMWMEQHEPQWTLEGRTLSEEQAKFAQTKLPSHKFNVVLQSYNELPEDAVYDAIYSIEAMIHSTNIKTTLKAWAQHLNPQHGAIVVIDDFLTPGTSKTDPDVDLFAKSWLANTAVTVTELARIGQKYGLELVESRDLTAEYRIVELNYRNQVPKLDPDNQSKNHQGWMGSKYRQKLTVEGKLGYYMVVFQKSTAQKALGMPAKQIGAATDTKSVATTDENSKNNAVCDTVPSSTESNSFAKIKTKDECLSGWYCCNKGDEFFQKLAQKRTHNYDFLKLDPKIFGDYMEAFAKHLNEFFATLPPDYNTKGGKFLDIGATGSTASGMQQVTSKFQHFAGPLEYWKLDSDLAAQNLTQTIVCDICNCPQADTCGFDITFSHTVLEHASHPDKAFDTIARATKKGGLTMHLVPWSYQYHATPDDYYRFSHSALRVLMEDRGFEVLEIGYDLCTRPEKAKKNFDEHYEDIWLTYVIAKKK